MQAPLAILFFFNEVANLSAIYVTAKALSTINSLHNRKMCMPFCRLLIFSKSTFRNKFLRIHQNVKQYGSTLDHSEIYFLEKILSGIP